MRYPVWILILAAGAACAQGLFVEPRLSVGSDLQVGGRAGLAGFTPPAGIRGTWSAFVDGEIRPLPEAVRVRISPTLTHQYRETRYDIGPGVAWALPLDEWENWFLVTGAGIAYTAGSYAGTAREAQSGLTGWGGLGVRYATDGNYYWEGGVECRPLPHIAPFRLLIQMGWVLK
jgi:hypothetical protein